jgi:3-hydroxyacyl-CoA dehydrogenase
MSIAQFTVADDVMNDFNQLFHKDKQSAVIEGLMRQIISDIKQQDKRQQAFYSLTNRRTLRPSISQNEIEQIRDEVRL